MIVRKVEQLDEQSNEIDNKWVSRLVTYWPIIIAIVVVIAGWVNFGNADSNMSIRVGELEEAQKITLVSQQVIQVQLGQIQTDLSWIRKALNVK